MDLRLILLASALALTGCSTGGGSPGPACAESTPGQVVEECRDSDEGEGPFNY